ncbi:hypothetical protein XCR_0035 [Xanthomonas campestris pv. raphani 756C]|nr:hypothetical protein XCR_0035 [Xanthomonas campestris pv. raphani 756C]
MFLAVAGEIRCPQRHAARRGQQRICLYPRRNGTLKLQLRGITLPSCAVFRSGGRIWSTHPRQRHFVMPMYGRVRAACNDARGASAKRPVAKKLPA